jgi:hypothetical protein
VSLTPDFLDVVGNNFLSIKKSLKYQYSNNNNKIINSGNLVEQLYQSDKLNHVIG